MIPLFASIFVFDRARAVDRHQQRDPRHAWRAISLTRDEARRIAANVANPSGLLAAARTASGTAAKGAKPLSDEGAESDGLLTPEEEEELRRK